LTLGPRLFSSSEVSATERGFSGATEVSGRSPGETSNLSWRARAGLGQGADRLAAITYENQYGRVEVGVQQASGAFGTFLQASGGIALVDGGAFASRQIDGAFAVADAGIKGMPILFENRVVGRTGRKGKLLIPTLAAYQPNRIAFDTHILPLDEDVVNDSFTISPGRGAGAVVRLARVAAPNAALVGFVDHKGQPIEVGASGLIESGAPRFLVGYDGQAYLTGLSENNTVIIEDSVGRKCLASFAFKRMAGQQVQIGPVPCVAIQVAQR
jgi:outer membrane usher protein